MAQTQVDVCNMALGRIGISERIENINDDSPEARACLLEYDTILDKLLKKFDWPFARRLLALNLLQEDLIKPWRFAYEWPSRTIMVKALRLDDELYRRTNHQRLPYQSYTDDAGTRYLLANIEDAKLWYIHRTTTVPDWPESFSNAMAWWLGSEIAGPLTSDDDLADRTATRMRQEVAAAIADAANDEQRVPEPESETILYREGSVARHHGIPADAYDYGGWYYGW